MVQETVTAQQQQEAEDKLQSWYDRWRDKIHTWVAGHTAHQLADVVMLVPDLAMLLVRLIRDNRVPMKFKAQLILAAAYLVAPIDILPEAVMNVAGLGDDVMIISLVILNNLTSIKPEVLREHWSGQGDVVATLQNVVSLRKGFASAKVMDTVNMIMGNKKAKPDKKAK